MKVLLASTIILLETIETKDLTHDLIPFFFHFYFFIMFVNIFYTIFMACLLFNTSHAAICLIPFLCSTSVTESATSSSYLEPTTATLALTLSSTMNSGFPSSSAVVSETSEMPVAITMTSNTPSLTITSSSPKGSTTLTRNTRSALPSLSSTMPTNTATTEVEIPEPYHSKNTIPIVIGSVAGFVVLLVIGFAYAFFSRTRKNIKKRLYSESDGMFEYTHYDIPINKYTNEVPPANQWVEQQQPYGYNSSPQVLTTQDSYYANSPHMGYANPANYYNRAMTTPAYHQNHDLHYQNPQLKYSPQPIENSASNIVYSPPNSYDHDIKK